jgi:hypothetical protein
LKVTGSDRFQAMLGNGFTTTGQDRVVDPPLPVQMMV